MNAVEVRDLYGGYENKVVLKNISTAFEKGKFTSVAGPNGCGKTTLLRYLIRQLCSKDGVILINGRDINSYSRKDLAIQTSFLCQLEKPQFPFTVLQTVMMGRFAHNDKSSDQALKALELTGISNLSDCPVTELSGGQYQLVMLARVICQDTPIIILDEPLNNLDPSHQISLLSILKQLTNEGKTVICVMHDLNAALQWSDNCILMQNGSVKKQGPVEDVLTPDNIRSVYNVETSLINLSDGRLQLAFCCSPGLQQHPY